MLPQVKREESRSLLIKDAEGSKKTCVPNTVGMHTYMSEAKKSYSTVQIRIIFSHGFKGHTVDSGFNVSPEVAAVVIWRSKFSTYEFYLIRPSCKKPLCSNRHSTATVFGSLN